MAKKKAVPDPPELTHAERNLIEHMEHAYQLETMILSKNRAGPNLSTSLRIAPVAQTNIGLPVPMNLLEHTQSSFQTERYLSR